MEVVWLGIAVICGIIWAWISISQKMTGDKHQRKAREFAVAGDWEQAALSYKLAIISRLDSHDKLRELTDELAQLHKLNGQEADLSEILECPDAIKNLGAGTGNQRKKNELMVKVYTEAGAFLDRLPGQVPKVV
jgi:hypothetical protein